ncbi:serine/threonine protein kinase [Dysgonomonas sp. 521]|uniref:serine/threonine-protein kinase n=1 Tax=Dysgonomonas sp. 521 TaxID=2302932 RepID=UPI0013D20BD9|nr:serine/threonine-protein kinase [Dysgonomonas sp. 521]NDV96994.1 serine/threonine protein kinase [Dysgonomonas sp. 521]
MDNSDFGKIDFSFPFDDCTEFHSQGSTSDCYKVRINGKWHFFKRPKKELNRNPFYLSAFEKEFDLGFNLEHPNIVRYINKGKDETGTYFITEFIDGLTLDEFIEQNPDYFKQKQHVEKFINQLLSAVSYLHSKQILHLDLKPQNILITHIDCNVKLIDLGFSYSDCYQTLTIGKTDLYAAPEQINNGKIDQRTDIYGIGMILLYVFTQTSDKKSLSKIPSNYRPIVSKCLSDSIENRYFDIASLKKDIAQSSKNKPAKYWLLCFVVLCVGLFFLVKPYSEKQREVQDEAMVVSDTNKEGSKEIQDSISQDIATKPNIENKSINSEPTTVIVRPELTIKDVSMDSFCDEFREKARTELTKIYKFTKPVVYSLEDQEKRHKQGREFYKQWIEPIEDYKLRNEVNHIFGTEYMVVAFPYIREQFLAYLDKAKNQTIPDNITNAKDVYRLIDKEMAEKFIVFMKDYPIITAKLDGKLFNEYEQKKENTYRQYKHLFENKIQFEERYYSKNKKYDHNIIYINDWTSDIFSYWAAPQYRTEDNPYIQIKLGG